MIDGGAKRAMGERLAEAVERAIETSRTPASLASARDAAQIVGLPGLERLLAVLATLAPAAGAPWSEATFPIRDRLMRLVRDCREEQGIEPLARADAEMAALAAQIEGLEWSEPGHSEAVMMLSLAEVFGALELEPGVPGVDAVRVSGPVGAALKAVFDWLSSDGTGRRVRVDAGAIEMVIDRPDPAALPASGHLLAAVGGCLLPIPARGTARSWRIRVPTLVPPPMYLMVRQGKLPLALPWHSVAGIHMTPDGGDSAGAIGLPRLAPLAPLGRVGARPVLVVVASGLRRACLLADRLVWRFAATPHDHGKAPAPELGGAVRTEDGDVYWVVDPSRLLGVVPEPELDVEPPAPRQVVTPNLEAERATPENVPAQGEDAAPAAAAEVLGELTSADVEPMTPPPATVEPTVSHARAEEPVAPQAPIVEHAAPPRPVGEREAPTPQPTARHSPDPVPPPKAAAMPPPPTAEATTKRATRHTRPRRALVADDALVARRFLSRMLEQEGFEVHAVERAAELLNALAQPWDVVMADVELPDGRGSELMRRVLDRSGPDGPVIVALVRDAIDRQAALEAGVTHALRKPFDRDAVAALLVHTGLVGGPAHA